MEGLTEGGGPNRRATKGQARPSDASGGTRTLSRARGQVTRLWCAFCHGVSCVFTSLRGPNSRRLAVTIGPYVPFPPRPKENRSLMGSGNVTRFPSPAPRPPSLAVFQMGRSALWLGILGLCSGGRRKGGSLSRSSDDLSAPWPHCLLPVP